MIQEWTWNRWKVAFVGMGLLLWLLVVLVVVLLRQASGFGVQATPTPTARFVQRYAYPEEIVPIATTAAENCGKAYFGTLCGNPPRYVR